MEKKGKQDKTINQKKNLWEKTKQYFKALLGVIWNTTDIL